MTLPPSALWAEGEKDSFDVRALAPLYGPILLAREIGEGRLTPVSFECARLSGESFSVPLALIFLVMETERGKVGEYSVNTNGSRDLGPMQINSLWLPILGKLGIEEETVRDNGCVNVAVAAWILRGHLLDTGDPLKALARYHSKTPKRGKIYLSAALSRADSLDVSKVIERANGNLSGSMGR
jgi:hypothetical protein